MYLGWVIIGDFGNNRCFGRKTTDFWQKMYFRWVIIGMWMIKGVLAGKMDFWWKTTDFWWENVFWVGDNRGFGQ